MRILIATISLFLFLPGQVTAGKKVFATWAELWSHHNYSANNLSNETGFFLNTTVIRGGPRLFIAQKKFFSLSFDPFLELESVIDVFDGSHNNLYNNNGKFSPGLKLGIRQYNRESFFSYFQADLYMEYRWLFNFSENNSEIFKKISNTDQVAGVKCWSNSRDEKTLFGYELFSDFSRHRTNFSDIGKHNYLIFTVSPCFLLKPWGKSNFRSPLKKFSLTYNPELVMDLYKKLWNFNPYSNKIQNRIGLRYIFVFPMKSFGKTLQDNSKTQKKFLNFLVYSDYTFVRFLKNPENWSLPGSDIRAGLILYIPFGNNQFNELFIKRL